MTTTDPNGGRQAVVQELRQFRNAVTGHAARLETIKEKLLQRLSRAASETLYRFGSTEDKLLDSLARCDDQVAFLQSGRRVSDRMFLGRHVFNQQGLANYVLERSRLSTAVEGGTVRTRAIAVLSQQKSVVQKQLDVLRRQRSELQAAARHLLQHVDGSISFGLLEPNAGWISDIRAAIWVAFDESYVSSAHQESAQARGVQLLDSEHLHSGFTRLLAAYSEMLQLAIPKVVARRKDKLLHAAARQTLEQLANHHPDQQLHPLLPIITAIAGVHFAFACEQQKDVGRMPAETRIGYQAMLDRSSPGDIENAIKQILRHGILTRDNLELLSYVSPVRSAMTRLGL